MTARDRSRPGVREGLVRPRVSVLGPGLTRNLMSAAPGSHDTSTETSTSGCVSVAEHGRQTAHIKTTTNADEGTNESNDNTRLNKTLAGRFNRWPPEGPFARLDYENEQLRTVACQNGRLSFLSFLHFSLFRRFRPGVSPTRVEASCNKQRTSHETFCLPLTRA